MKTFAFLGDSITFGSCLTDSSKRFSSIVCKKFGAEEKNFGLPGSLLANAGTSRTDKNAFVHRISLIDNADIALIFGGTNDYFWSDRPINPPTDISDNSYFSNAIKEICLYITENRKPGTTFLMTPYPHKGIGNYFGGETYTSSTEHETNQLNYNKQRLSDYVEAIQKAGKTYNIPVINLYDAEGFDYRTMTLDGCHPNEIGHRWIAQIVESQFEKIY